MRKLIFGIIVSGIAIYFLQKNFDISEFERLEGKVNWWIFPLLILSNLWAFIPFSIRWYHLLEKKITFHQSFSTAIIGVGLNMVLPARGGDLVRLLMNKRDSDLPLTHLLSRIFLEKVMDLGSVVVIGATALFYMGLGQSKNLSLLLISSLVIIGMLVGLILVKYFLFFLRSVALKCFSLIGKQSLYETKLDHHLVEFSEFLQGDKLIKPLAYLPVEAIKHD